MTNLKSVAHVVGKELHDLEQAHLKHVSDSVALLSSLVAAGRSLDVPFSVQQRILAPALDAMAKLGAVGDGYAQTHRELAAYVRKQGLCPSMFGQTAPGPDVLVGRSFADAPS
jgi:hypothetical protein